MSATDETVDDAPEASMTRLEAALERIERGARPPNLPDSAVAARLDALIAHLRRALAEAAA